MSTNQITGRDPRSGRSIRVNIEDGLITRIEETLIEETKMDETKTEEKKTDCYLSAGFVDLQVNGCSGFDLNEEQISTETVAGLASAMFARAVTSFAPTLISAPEPNICRALEIIAKACKSHPKLAACIPFVHVEGPHISSLDGYRGAHPAAAIRPPSIAEFDRWQNAAGGIVGMVTISPHFDESAEYVAAMVKRGVHVAIGHTHATPAQIKLAVDAGARLSTHLGNGIALEIPRHNNPIWSQLADDRLTATFIADGHHLPPQILKVILRAKGIERSVLISDSVELAGLPAGVYETPVGGKVELRADGKLCVFGSSLLAGSTASLAQCIGHVVRTTGMPLYDALAMATMNPGRFVGGRGLLQPGSRADLVRFRWRDEVFIEDVWLAGEQVYESHAEARG